MLFSTGSKEIQQLRWNSSLGRIFGAVFIEPLVVGNAGPFGQAQGADPACRRTRGRRNTQSRMTVDDAAPDHAECHEHHLHRVRDHIPAARSASKRSTPTVGTMPELSPRGSRCRSRGLRPFAKTARRSDHRTSPCRDRGFGRKKPPRILSVSTARRSASSRSRVRLTGIENIATFEQPVRAYCLQ